MVRHDWSRQWKRLEFITEPVLFLPVDIEDSLLILCALQKQTNI